MYGRSSEHTSMLFHSHQDVSILFHVHRTTYVIRGRSTTRSPWRHRGARGPAEPTSLWQLDSTLHLEQARLAFQGRLSAYPGEHAHAAGSFERKRCQATNVLLQVAPLENLFPATNDCGHLLVGLAIALVSVHRICCATWGRPSVSVDVADVCRASAGTTGSG